MKKIFGALVILLTVLLALPSCSKEDEFPTEGSVASGTASFAAFKKGVEVNTAERVVRSGDEVDLSAFLVEVTRGDKTYYSGTLQGLPEILSLPVGEGYEVRVHSPENPAAAWDSPYYEGLQTFDVAEGEVTYVDTVVCTLANVKVTIVFDPALLPLMDDDCQVTVETGTGASLVFGKNETRAGYFKYEAAQGEATLVARFSGTVDENYESNFKTYTSVLPGNHYRITYTLHGVNSETPDMDGKLTMGAYVDAAVEREDLTVNIDDEDETLADNDRPTQGDKPVTPPEQGDGPSVTLKGSLDDSAWSKANVVTDGMEIKVKVHSDSPSGLTKFTVDIDSETLTPEVLTSVGLGAHLDLVNPGSFEEGLRGLNFPVFVGGQKDPDEMDITSFLPLLGVYGAATHKFIITVADANGTTEKTLTLISK